MILPLIKKISGFFDRIFNFNVGDTIFLRSNIDAANSHSYVPITPVVDTIKERILTEHENGVRLTYKLARTGEAEFDECALMSLKELASVHQTRQNEYDYFKENMRAELDNIKQLLADITKASKKEE